MAVEYRINWDLDSLFPGKSNGASFHQWLEDVDHAMDALKQQVASVSNDAESDWIDAYLALQSVARNLFQARSFVECLTADDMGDARAAQLEKRVDSLDAAFAGITVQFESGVAGLPYAIQAKILADDRVKDIRFSLEERIRRVKHRLDPLRESLIADLGVDGYQGWERMYYALLNQMSVTYEQNGKPVTLSMGQAANKLTDADRSVRKAVFPAWIAAWEKHADLFAETLNHIAGFRLTVYRNRGWDDVLYEPIENNRIHSQTLSAMWSTIERNKSPLVDYLNRKARLMGVDKLEWFDFGAPLPEESSDISFADAAAFVVDQFRRFSPDMGAFAERAIKEGWVEAENRPGKRTGAFCTRFPASGQSRVFMTFSGTTDNISTLAHELGHAYHGLILSDIPYFSTRYTMGLAESASTFAEAIVVDAALRETTDKRAKISLLDQKIQNAVAFMMDIHARFLFETRFYEARRQGAQRVEDFCNLMVGAQRDAFCNALATYHPYFWASKLHFYDTTNPFYNFPYTVGYLFSSGLYAQAKEEGPQFADKYVALLRDTGRMRMEDVAKLHLGVDLVQPDFWQRAIDEALQDVQEFLRLTE